MADYLLHCHLDLLIDASSNTPDAVRMSDSPGCFMTMNGPLCDDDLVERHDQLTRR